MNSSGSPALIEEVRSGVDWLSATVARDETGAGGWYAFAQSCIRQVAREGHEVELRTMLGFNGWKAGGCFAGENERRYYCQLSGEYADRWFQTLDAYEPHYSRLDLQVTVRFVVEQLDVAQAAYRQYLGAGKAGQQPRSRKAYIIIGSDGGDTCYVGAPSSRQRARLYNKAKQSEAEAYERCWRYEVVLRDELAREWAALWRTNRLSRQEHVLLTVGEWFEARGIDTAFRHGTDLVVLPKLRTLPTDIERKIEWLRTQVRPTILYLTEAGFGSIVREALGLSPDEPDAEREHAT